MKQKQKRDEMERWKENGAAEVKERKIKRPKCFK